jgi:hypothetical protein
MKSNGGFGTITQLIVIGRKKLTDCVKVGEPIEGIVL